MKLKSLVLAAVAAVSLAGSAWAHHSHANYDTTSFTQLEGTVKQVRWMNPHTWVLIEVMEGGKPVMWTLEGGSPQALLREGWKKEDIKVGDPIKARCHRIKDGANSCLFGFLSVPGKAEKELD